MRDSLDDAAEWPGEWEGRDAGNTPWGKHANMNSGVSLMRAHREIQLDESWLSGDDSRERWWTIEVDFPTALDEVFGVTNNKQGTMTFQRLARYDWRREAFPDERSTGDVRRRMEAEGDHRAKLLELRHQIEKVRTVMRDRVRQARQRRPTRHGEDESKKADAIATAGIERRQKEGHQGASDRAGATGTEEEHRAAQVESLVEKHHFDWQEALKRVEETIREGHRVRWINSAQSSAAFFDVEPFPNVVQVAFNTNHPISSSHLFDVVNPDIDEFDEQELRASLATLTRAFRILVYAWARYEDEQTDRAKRGVRDARVEWGKYAEEFFDDDDDSIAPTDSL